MGLFDKRPPCAICGGKVKGLLPWKIEGNYICDDCHGVVDVQDGEQAAQVVNTDGGDNKDNGHGVTSGGLGSGIQWVT